MKLAEADEADEVGGAPAPRASAPNASAPSVCAATPSTCWAPCAPATSADGASATAAGGSRPRLKSRETLSEKPLRKFVAQARESTSESPGPRPFRSLTPIHMPPPPTPPSANKSYHAIWNTDNANWMHSTDGSPPRRRHAHAPDTPEPANLAVRDSLHELRARGLVKSQFKALSLITPATIAAASDLELEEALPSRPAPKAVLDTARALGARVDPAELTARGHVYEWQPDPSIALPHPTVLPPPSPITMQSRPTTPLKLGLPPAFALVADVPAADAPPLPIAVPPIVAKPVPAIKSPPAFHPVPPIQSAPSPAAAPPTPAAKSLPPSLVAIPALAIPALSIAPASMSEEEVAAAAAGADSSVEDPSLLDA